MLLKLGTCLFCSALLHDQVLSTSRHSSWRQKDWGKSHIWGKDEDDGQEEERKVGEQKIKDEQFGSRVIDRLL